jgi:hypothetical protein
MSDNMTVEVTAHDLPLHCPQPNAAAVERPSSRFSRRTENG